MISESLIASRADELSQFFRDVRGSDLSQREYLASWLMETQGKPDSYYFLRRNGKLLDPTTGQPISNFIRRDSYIGYADGIAFDRIQEFSSQEILNPYIWISPSYRDIYPTPKIIVCEIVDDRLQNWSIKLSCNDAQCVQLANILEGYERYHNPEEVRIQPIPWQLSPGMSWVDALSQIFTNEPELQQAKTDTALNDKHQALQEAERILISNRELGYDSPEVRRDVERLIQEGVIGSSNLSCPSMLAGELLVSNSTELKFVKNCGQCGVVINKLIGKGYKCNTCGGTYEGC